VSDKHGNLQYIPFPTCAETAAPLALPFARSLDINCTITLTDPLFHLLEYYLHGDAPLSCRVPAGSPSGERLRRLRPGDGAGAAAGAAAAAGWEGGGHVPLVLAIAGALEKSHLHVRAVLNVAVHHAPSAPARGPGGGGVVRAAGAYSAGGGRAAEEGTRAVIGDEVPLVLRVRWYAADGLPGAEGEEAGRGGVWRGRSWWEVLWMVAVGYLVCYVQLRVPWRRGGRDVLPTSQASRLTYGQAMAQGFGKRE
jgi:hypothetical protein